MTWGKAFYYCIENIVWSIQRNRKKFYVAAGVIAALAVICCISVFLIVPNVQYAQAQKLVKNNDYVAAARIFKKLGNFRDSRQFNEVYSLLAAEKGDTVTFGSFDQDGNERNGAEPIEWIVLEEDGPRVRLISRYLLETMPYSMTFGPTTWDTSRPRNWLNTTFYDDAFNDKERAAIELVHNTASANERYPIQKPGDDTDDYVSLLTLYEVKEFFPDDNDKYTAATEHAIQNGARVLPETGKSWWWTRTIGVDAMMVAAVHGQYQVVFDVADFYGCNVNNDEGCVRPVIWVNMDEYAAQLGLNP